MAYKATIGERSGVDVRWLDTRTLELSFDHARFIRLSHIKSLKVKVKGTVDPPES